MRINSRHLYPPHRHPPERKLQNSHKEKRQEANIHTGGNAGNRYGARAVRLNFFCKTVCTKVFLGLHCFRNNAFKHRRACIPSHHLGDMVTTGPASVTITGTSSPPKSFTAGCSLGRLHPPGADVPSSALRAPTSQKKEPRDGPF